MTATATRTRDDALDALRGLAIFGMVLVNLQGSDAHVFPILAHAPWNGLTIADLVFPLFLLCVGLSLPLAMDGREPPASIGRIVRRSVLLYLIGFSIGWIVHASPHLIDIRFTGVLARIGIVYLVCALTVRSTSGWRVPALAAVALMAVHGALLYAAPPGGVASMAQGAGFSGWLDRAVLGGTRLYGKVFDPEGPLSTLSAIATAMIGVAVQRLTIQRPNALFKTAVLCFVAAFGPWFLWPVNKALWTPTFVVINAAIGLGMLCLLKSFWPSIGALSPVRLAARLGQVALTLYVVHALLTAILVIRVGGERLWVSSFDALTRLGLPLDWTSLLYAAIAGTLSVLITLALAKRGWVLRV
ncbi:heparan-alpha-glucosaminide N-acetyltransferase domain-containing protein [Sphingomonas bacterium]|uniref:heparan-alpha-glucosaminide N-acetyltransferase domain-containing protein n=1 Tax=Sphingomonas bacterium TaxID=1895847 RepID=UPI00261124E1|nr:heparan-alpha-glucosaminide N-acetyltransferase domain-containing protein [Sphingomonas bacterium]